MLSQSVLQVFVWFLGFTCSALLVSCISTQNSPPPTSTITGPIPTEFSDTLELVLLDIAKEHGFLIVRPETDVISDINARFVLKSLDSSKVEDLRLVTRELFKANRKAASLNLENNSQAFFIDRDHRYFKLLETGGWPALRESYPFIGASVVVSKPVMRDSLIAVSIKAFSGPVSGYGVIRFYRKEGSRILRLEDVPCFVS